jgi:CubicO group peptidase (beta-lactamase class C family)
VRPIRVLVIALLVAAGFAQQAASQSLTLLVFERYLDSLREQAAIPGMSAALVQHGVVVWERGFGRQDVGANVFASPTTPYPIAGLSQVLGSTLLLEKCVDQSYLSTADPVNAWNPAFPEPQTSVRDLLTHTAPVVGGFRLDLSRFSALTPIVERCADVPYYSRVLATEILDRFAMIDAVPSQTQGTPSPIDLQWFDNPTLVRYAATLARVAVPYRVDRSGKPSRSDFLAQPTDAATGVVATVRDLAKFDAALSHGFILSPEALRAAWSSAQGMPTGLGWFVQNYNGELVVWQYGVIKDAYSSLIVKLPNRDATLILLANSDRLNSPFTLENGDVTVSLFAQLFLKFATGQ